ncbi:MAG: hypothetical protein R2685_17580 [Candidatus Nitrosocosmicus sp.]|jgi:hypothetical protein|nr:hypothetical protein [Candidatus Nitrosocosmicus sp.]
MFIVAALVGSIIAISGVNNAVFATKKKSKTLFKTLLKKALQTRVQNVFQITIH